MYVRVYVYVHVHGISFINLQTSHERQPGNKGHAGYGAVIDTSDISARGFKRARVCGGA